MTNPILSNEYQGALLGVRGRFTSRTIGGNNYKPGTFTHQHFISEARPLPSYEEGAEIRFTARFDDDCRNGHNTFSITADIFKRTTNGRTIDLGGGAAHEAIAEAFPEVTPLIPWHLTSSDGPMHYIANTIYHAGNRDHNGLLAGERRQIRNGRTGELAWTLEAVNAEGTGLSDNVKYAGADTVPLYALTKSCDGAAPPLATPTLRWVPWCHVGEGKARDLDAARHSAVWPEATDAELSVEPDTLRAVLMARHADLCARFHAVIEGAGFVWAPPATVEA